MKITGQIYQPGNTLSATETNYDNTGNITTITDSLDGSRTQSFQYDHLNRLTQAYRPAYGTITYQYNEIGNITYNSRVGSYSYWKDYYGTKPHAVRYAGSYSYEYDANGNMTMRNGVTITYDYDNRPTNIGSLVLVYDYSGQRVKKNSTVYIGKIYECNGSTCTKYIFASSARIASQSSSKTYFYHTDHLGSSNIITNEMGNKVQETYYYPFGETQYNSGNATHYKFTGQEEDPETGLYYYGARYYDPIIGRFISADSIVQAPFDPQTLNRYSYCINNPLIYTDPSGHWIGELILAMLIAKDVAQITALAEGQSFGESYTAAFQGAVTGAIFYAGAVIFPGNAILAGIVGGMAAGGCIAALTGGNVGQGIIIGGITGGIAGGIGTIAFDNAYLEGLVTIGSGALIGGGVSELTGGSFSQGAFIGGISATVSFAMKYASSKAMSGKESEENASYNLGVNKAEMDIKIASAGDIFCDWIPEGGVLSYEGDWKLHSTRPPEEFIELGMHRGKVECFYQKDTHYYQKGHWNCFGVNLKTYDRHWVITVGTTTRGYFIPSGPYHLNVIDCEYPK